MRQYFGVLVTTVLLCIPVGRVRAGDDASAILDKAIKALGGDEKLSNVAAFTWTANGSIKQDGGVNDSVFVVTFKGLDHVRRDYRTRSPYRLILNGNKGWYTAGGRYRPMDKDAIEKQKRLIYLQVVPTLLVPLKGPGFKYEAAGEEVVRGKPAFKFKIIGPDGQDFALLFDKESFLPVKEVARTIRLGGKEQIEETFFAGYKEMGGIKKATVIETRVDPENYGYFDIIDFKVLDQLSPGMFAPPQ